MAEAYISIGSNIEPLRHIRAALRSLYAQFGNLSVSPVYESHAVGFEGNNFYNLVVGLSTDKDVFSVNRLLSKLETENGRIRTPGQKFNSRTLDLDLLLYDDLCLDKDGLSLPRDEILKYAFVLRPLADILPEGRHPQTGERYFDLWARFDKSSQPMWEVDVKL